jgi:hypothetical protein
VNTLQEEDGVGPEVELALGTPRPEKLRRLGPERAEALLAAVAQQTHLTCPM